MLYRDVLPQAPLSPRPHALVVEDDPDTRDALCRLLTRLGYATDDAGTVNEALTKLEARPDRLILDLRLGDGNGLSVLRHIRERQLQIDVAVLSGAAGDEVLADAAVMRPDALFTKPADLTEIAAWLNACGGRSAAPTH